MGRGASFEELADIRGNSPEVVRKHYRNWSSARQSYVDGIVTGFVYQRSKIDSRNRRYPLGTRHPATAAEGDGSLTTLLEVGHNSSTYARRPFKIVKIKQVK